MKDRSCLTVILAAGEGTRMKSRLPKVLHKVAGLPMVSHVMTAAREAGPSRIAIVVGREAELVRAAIGEEDACFFMQAERLGTAHAVLSAREQIAAGHDDIVVMFGDTPLIEARDVAALRAELSAGADIAVMGFETDAPAGYGRLIMSGEQLTAIREDRDCSEAERRITFCNGGVMAIAGKVALQLLDAIGNDNAKGEYYLTDIVEIAVARGLRVAATSAPYESVLGINNRSELAEAEAIWQKRRRHHFMLEGVTMPSPETVFFSHDTQIAPDVTIEPHVVFALGVTVQTGATIRAFSHLEGASVGEGAEVGPYARLRPGADLRRKAKVGNFCEVKKAVIEDGAKINHLTYIGDAHVGAGANVGAGTITCNYDGFGKHLTVIGAGAFIGSNSSLVAPVTIGEGGYVASGSVVTANVPEGALAIGRSRQVTKDGYGTALRARLAAASGKKP